MISELDELLGLAEESEAIEAKDYTGSLDYIDSLPTKPPFTIHTGVSLGRDAADISNALIFSAVSALDQEALPRGSVLLTDNRRFSPMTYYDPGELVKGSSRIVQRVNDLKPGDPGWEEEHQRFLKISKKPVHPWARKPKIVLGFDLPSRVGICIKRKIRREVMHAFGLAGYFYKPRRFTMWSRVIC